MFWGSSGLEPVAPMGGEEVEREGVPRLKDVLGLVDLGRPSFGWEGGPSIEGRPWSCRLGTSFFRLGGFLDRSREVPRSIEGGGGSLDRSRVVPRSIGGAVLLAPGVHCHLGSHSTTTRWDCCLLDAILTVFGVKPHLRTKMGTRVTVFVSQGSPTLVLSWSDEA